MIRKSAGVAVLSTAAVVVVVFSLSGTSQGVSPPGEHAVAWTPPPPNAVPLDCAGGMTFAPAPPTDAHRMVPAPSDVSDAPEEPASGGWSPAPPTSPTPHALADAMTADARAGFPGVVAGLLRYEVTESGDAAATLVGTLGGRRLVLAPAVRNADGSWAWRDARPVLNPNGVWVTQGTMIACDEVFDRA